MPPIHDRSEIDIDDITVAKRHLVRNPVTDHFVHTGAKTVGIRFVSKTGRNMTMIHRVFVDQLIQFQSRRSRFDEGSDVVHQFRVEMTRGTQSVSFFFGHVERTFGLRLTTQHVHDR